MTTARHNVARIGILAQTLALLLLAVAALACAPTQPAGQHGDATVRAVPTPEVTTTPTPEDTAAPTPEATATSTPEATATATAEPTNTVAPSPTQNPLPLDGILSAWVAGVEAQQSAQGGSAQTASEKTIAVLIMLKGEEYRSAITDFLDSNDIDHERVTGPFPFNIFATVPVTMITQLASFPGVVEMVANPYPYPDMGGLNNLVARYEAGLMPDEDANPTYARLVIIIEGDKNHDAVKRFLDEKGVVMAFADRDIDKPRLVAFVPVGLMVPLVNMEGVTHMGAENYPVPAGLRITMPSIYDEPTPSATP